MPLLFGSTAPTPSATSTVLGKIALAGDLGGTALAPLVLKLNGVALSGTPSLGQTLIATSPTGASWQTPTLGATEDFAFFMAG